MTENKYSIEVKNFTKKFGSFVAVDDISFNVEQGTIFAFLGPNGAGKSTTINTLCTIQGKTSGELKINGYDVTHQQDKVRKDIGIVFQESTLDGKLTIEENLKLHCCFYKVRKANVKERIDFALELVDLTSRRKSIVESLSGGMKRRAEIARGLVHLPKVLFLDEPTAGLDPQNRAGVWEYLLELQKQKNITIFLTTHYLDEAEICDKVAIIDNGKIVAHDTPYNLKMQYSSTKLNLRLSDGEQLTQYLLEHKIKYKTVKDIFSIYGSDHASIMEIVSIFKEKIEDIEINKGSLNEVFITITGKEIKE